jgi:hypothetical protein
MSTENGAISSALFGTRPRPAKRPTVHGAVHDVLLAAAPAHGNADDEVAEGERRRAHRAARERREHVGVGPAKCLAHCLVQAAGRVTEGCACGEALRGAASLSRSFCCALQWIAARLTNWAAQ